jgi:hypothetical protein
MDIEQTCGEASGAGRCHASQAVINKIESLGNTVRIGCRIKIKGMGLHDGIDGIEACKGKSNDEINAYRAEKRFRGGLFACSMLYEHLSVKAQARNSRWRSLSRQERDRKMA